MNVLSFRRHKFLQDTFSEGYIKADIVWHGSVLIYFTKQGGFWLVNLSSVTDHVSNAVLKGEQVRQAAQGNGLFQWENLESEAASSFIMLMKGTF